MATYSSLCGFEIGDLTSERISSSAPTVTGSVALDTSIFRTGARSLRLTPASGAVGILDGGAGTNGTGVRCSFFCRVTVLPATTRMLYGNTGAGILNVRLTPTGALELRRDTTVIGTSTTLLDTQARWYLIEVNGDGGTNETLYIDGVLQVSGSGSGVTNMKFGANDTVAATYTAYIDDVAVFSSPFAAGTNRKVVLLVPVSDAQDGSWTGGAGGTGIDLFEAVNNQPPAGLVSASATNTSQIESADSSGGNSTDEYRANMTSYLDAGLSIYDTVNSLVGIINHGEDIATNTKTGSFGGQSNPSWTYDTFTFGADAGAVGSFPTNWSWTRGTFQNTPAVTLTSNLVLAVRKTDAGTRVASVDFMGVYVDYTPFPFDVTAVRTFEVPEFMRRRRPAQRALNFDGEVAPVIVRQPRNPAINHQNPGVL